MTEPDVRSKYRIQQQGQVQSASQVEQQVHAENVARYGPFFATVMGMVADPGRVDDMLDAQAVQLKQQGVMTRHAPPAPGMNYLAFPHAKLHEMVNNGIDSKVVYEAGETWTDLGNKFVKFGDKVVKALGSSEIQWTGEAADGARKALAKIANSGAETGKAAQLAGTLAAQQSRAISDAKASVPPPPAQPFDPQAANAKRAQITDPAAYSKQADADAALFAEQRKQHEEAARRVEAYDRTMSQVAAAQPAFAPEPPAPPQPPRNPNDPKQPRYTPPPGSTGRTPPPIGGNDITNPSWTAPPNDVTNTSGVNNTNHLNVNNQQGGGNNQQGNNSFNHNNLMTGVQRPGGGDRTGGGSGRTGGGGGTGAGRGGPGMGAGRVGTPGGMNAGFGPKGSAPMAGVMPGEAGRGGAGAGAGGAAGARGAAGAGAMGGAGAGAGKGQGAEDTEHTSKYLEHTDEYFGDDRMVAPPVIGG